MIVWGLFFLAMAGASAAAISAFVFARHMARVRAARRAAERDAMTGDYDRQPPMNKADYGRSTLVMTDCAIKGTPPRVYVPASASVEDDDDDGLGFFAGVVLGEAFSELGSAATSPGASDFSGGGGDFGGGGSSGDF